MKNNNKITTNLVGTLEIGRIREWVPDFNPNNFDIDEVIEKIVSKGGGNTIIGIVMNQYNNNPLRKGQKVSLDYFLGNNDIKKQEEGDIVAVRNPLTGLYQPAADSSVYYGDRIVSPFHKNVIRELTGFTMGSKPIELKLKTNEKVKEETLKELNKWNNKWNNMSQLDSELVEDYLLYGFSGLYWMPQNKKNLLGEEEWRLSATRTEPMNTWAFTLGRVENELNKSDVVIKYNVKQEGLNIEVRAEIYTNKAIYTLDYSKKDGKETTKNFLRTPLWIKGGKEVDFIRPPFTFFEPEKYSQLIISSYKGMIDKKDKLTNTTVDDSINHKERIVFIKGAGLGRDFSSTLNEKKNEILAARKKTKDSGDGGGVNFLYADSNDASIESIDNSLPTEHTELAMGMLDKGMHDASSTINYNESSTNENYNAIKAKFNRILNRITPIREKLRVEKREALKMFIIFESQVNPKIAKDLINLIDDVVIEIDNGFLINELDQSNALTAAVAAKFISKKTASEVSSFGATDEFERITKQQKEEEELLAKQEAAKAKSLGTKEAGGTTTGVNRQTKTEIPK